MWRTAGCSTCWWAVDCCTSPGLCWCLCAKPGSGHWNSEFPKDDRGSCQVFCCVYCYPIYLCYHRAFSLSAVLGVPWSWFRLSVVGAVSYELTAAEMVSDALGFQSAGAMASANNYEVFGAHHVRNQYMHFGRNDNKYFLCQENPGEHDKIQKKQRRLGSCF